MASMSPSSFRQQLNGERHLHLDRIPNFDFGLIAMLEDDSLGKGEELGHQRLVFKAPQRGTIFSVMP